MRKALIIVALVAVLVLLAFAYYAMPGRAPAGQPALATLDPGNFGDFQRRFNGAADSIRVLLLLSPT